MLRHDKNLHTVKSQPHMKHVPEYLGKTLIQGVQRRMVLVVNFVYLKLFFFASLLLYLT